LEGSDLVEATSCLLLVVRHSMDCVWVELEWINECERFKIDANECGAPLRLVLFPLSFLSLSRPSGWLEGHDESLSALASRLWQSD
jgi:hypothetical protein